nr:MAG TPA: hypothetical protein [Caudoviricetes sp.]
MIQHLPAGWVKAGSYIYTSPGVIRGIIDWRYL